MKSIYKAISQTAAIIVCTLTVSFSAISPIYAADVPVLTQTQAVEKAISNSPELVKLSNSLISGQESSSKNSSSLVASASNPLAAYKSSLDYELSKMKINLDMAITEQDITKQKQMLEYTVSDYFASIINAETSLSQLATEIELEKTNQKIVDTKYQLGMISKTDYTKSKDNFAKLQASKTSTENSVEKAYTTLNRLMGEKPENRYELEFQLEYKELGLINLDDHIQNCIDNDSQIKSSLAQIDSAQFSYDNYTLSNVDASTGLIREGSESRDSYLRKIQQYNLDIVERKKKIEDTINNTYSDILIQEESYKTKTAELATLTKNLSVKNKEYELGKLTKYDLDSYSFSIVKLENEIQKLVYDHHLKVMKFKNVYLAVS